MDALAEVSDSQETDRMADLTDFKTDLELARNFEKFAASLSDQEIDQAFGGSLRLALRKENADWTALKSSERTDLHAGVARRDGGRFSDATTRPPVSVEATGAVLHREMSLGARGQPGLPTSISLNRRVINGITSRGNRTCKMFGDLGAADDGVAAEGYLHLALYGGTQMCNLASAQASLHGGTNEDWRAGWFCCPRDGRAVIATLAAMWTSTLKIVERV